MDRLLIINSRVESLSAECRLKLQVSVHMTTSLLIPKLTVDVCGEKREYFKRKSNIVLIYKVNELTQIEQHTQNENSPK